MHRSKPLSPQERRSVSPKSWLRRLRLRNENSGLAVSSGVLIKARPAEPHDRRDACVHENTFLDVGQQLRRKLSALKKTQGFWYRRGARSTGILSMICALMLLPVSVTASES